MSDRHETAPAELRGCPCPGMCQTVAEIVRLREALLAVRHYLRPGEGSHYPHGTTYAVQEIDEALHGKQ